MRVPGCPGLQGQGTRTSKDRRHHDSVYGVFSIPCAVCWQTAFRKVESKSGRCPAAQPRRSWSFQHDRGGVVLGQAQIETDVVVQLHAEVLDRRSGLKSILDFSVGGSSYFDGHLSVTRFPSFRRTS